MMRAASTGGHYSPYRGGNMDKHPEVEQANRDRPRLAVLTAGLFNAAGSAGLSLICNRCGPKRGGWEGRGFPSRRMSDSWDGNRVGGCRGRVFAVAGRAGGGAIRQLRKIFSLFQHLIWR